MKVKKSLVISFVLVLNCLLPGSSLLGLVLDWDNVAATSGWTPGSLDNSYDVDGDSINDIRVQVTPGAFNPNTTPAIPRVDTTISGGLNPRQNSLFLLMDFTPTSKSVQVIISFLDPFGATGVNFTIFDVDKSTGNNWQDRISNIRGNDVYSTNNYNVIPTVTGGSANTVNAATATVTGLSEVADDTANAQVDFGTTYLSSVRFTYESGPSAISDPTRQGISIYDITFLVPEASAVWSLLVLAVLLLQRRYVRKSYPLCREN